MALPVKTITSCTFVGQFKDTTYNVENRLPSPSYSYLFKNCNFHEELIPILKSWYSESAFHNCTKFDYHGGTYNKFGYCHDLDKDEVTLYK